MGWMLTYLGGTGHGLVCCAPPLGLCQPDGPVRHLPPLHCHHGRLSGTWHPCSSWRGCFHVTASR
eukprot:3545088-Rhodomonas_salina.1